MNIAFTPSAAAALNRMRLVSGETIVERATKKAIGNKSEARVAKALDFLKSLGIIYEYYQSIHKGELDKGLKIDFLITPTGEENRLIGLQVKSSTAEKEKHQKRSLLPCVAVRSFHFHTSIQILAEELMQVMGLSMEPPETTILSICPNCPMYSDSEQDLDDESEATEEEDESVNQLIDQLGFNYDLE